MAALAVTPRRTHLATAETKPKRLSLLMLGLISRLPLSMARLSFPTAPLPRLMARLSPPMARLSRPTAPLSRLMARLSPPMARLSLTMARLSFPMARLSLTMARLSRPTLGTILRSLLLMQGQTHRSRLT